MNQVGIGIFIYIDKLMSTMKSNFAMNTLNLDFVFRLEVICLTVLF